MNDRHVFPSVALQFSLGCILCTLVYMMTLGDQSVGICFPLILLPYGPAVYGLNCLFLMKQRTMRALVILNLVFGCGTFVAVTLVDGWSSWAGAVFAVLFLSWVTVNGARFAMEPPVLHSLILSLDSSAVVMVLFIGYLAAMGFPPIWGGPIAAGFAASVLGVITLRLSRALKLREWCFVAVAFGGLFVLVWALVVSIAAPAGQGVVALWNGLMALLRWGAGILWAILLFLASLMKPEDYGDVEPPDPFQIPMEELAVVETNPVAAVFFAVLGIILVVALVIWGLWMLGKLRIGGTGVISRTKGHERKRLSFWKGLKRLFELWQNKLKVRSFLWKNRSTPVGVYFLVEQKCRMGPWHKREGETPREFLVRLKSYAAGDEPLAEALAGLIPAVDDALYSGRGKTAHIPQARLIRRRIGGTVRRQFFRNLKRSVLLKMHRAA